MHSQPKSSLRTRAQDKASQRYQDRKARRACVDAVWRRSLGVHNVGRCESCDQIVYREWVNLLSSGHVHEKRARSLGGDPTDPNQCELLCYGCHFNGPSGAHRRSERP